MPYEQSNFCNSNNCGEPVDFSAYYFRSLRWGLQLNWDANMMFMPFRAAYSTNQFMIGLEDKGYPISDWMLSTSQSTPIPMDDAAAGLLISSMRLTRNLNFALRGRGAIGKVKPPMEYEGKPFPFGNEMHARIVQWLKERFPDVRFKFRVLEGQTGLDVRVRRGNPGFTRAEIKPRQPWGERSFERQLENWGLHKREVLPITYDHQGYIYVGWE